MKKRLLNLGVLLGVVCAPSMLLGQIQQKVAVTTYHYDNLRTGWNPQETILNPSLAPPPELAAVGLTQFGLVRRVPLDDLVYAQPLIVPDVTIAASIQPRELGVVGGIDARKHDVVYVVTENNTIYAIDANSGAILLTRNLGPAVDPPPYSCGNNGPRVGIESTPVIDRTNGVMYLIAYTAEPNVTRPTYRIHAIDLATLNDRVPPVIVAASHTLADGSNLELNPYEHRQRAALLLANGNIYAAFTSWGDISFARGWLLAWQAGTLKPLADSFLTPTLSMAFITDHNTPFDKSWATIWMSGYGVAADASGSLYFATGNSPDHNHSDQNLSESVLKVSADLRNLQDIFTPSDVNTLDPTDLDLGSGGVLLLPDQPGRTPHMAVVAGKIGPMYLLDRDHMGGGQILESMGGGFNPTSNNVLGEYPNQGCWCGLSYYANNVVSSDGDQIGVWHIDIPTVAAFQKPSLKKIYSATNLGFTGDPGFFTSVSSNGDTNMIIWAVSRHNSADPNHNPPKLFAFAPTPGTFQDKPLFPRSPKAEAEAEGCWDFPPPSGNPATSANSNIVPVVANGHIYVASYKQLAIYGFKRRSILEDVVVHPPACNPFGLVSTGGIITRVKGPRFTIKTKTGHDVEVDTEGATKRSLNPNLYVGQAVRVYGTTDAREELLHAVLIKGDFSKKALTDRAGARH